MFQFSSDVQSILQYISHFDPTFRLYFRSRGHGKTDVLGTYVSVVGV